MTRCIFCNRTLGEKKYYIKEHDKKKRVCSMCKFIHHTLISEYENGRGNTTEKIIICVKSGFRHCRICAHFIQSKTEFCKKGYWTGIGKNEDEYPNSFANHGCSNYSIK